MNQFCNVSANAEIMSLYLTNAYAHSSLIKSDSCSVPVNVSDSALYMQFPSPVIRTGFSICNRGWHLLDALTLQNTVHMWKR